MDQIDPYKDFGCEHVVKLQKMLEEDPELLINPGASETVCGLVLKTVRWNIRDLVERYRPLVADDSCLNIVESRLLKINLICIDLMINIGAKLTGPEWMGHSPAEIIFDRNNLDDRKEKLILLLQQGMDSDFRNERGENLLHIFVKYFVGADDSDAVEITQILLDAGLPLDEPCPNLFYTPLIYAIENQNTELVSFLIEKGADIHKRCFYGVFPLYIAVEYEKFDIVDLLVSKGADVDAMDDYEQTALHRACTRSYEQHIRLLIQKGADINVLDIHHFTPFFVMEPEEYTDSRAPGINIMIQEIAKLKSLDDSLVDESDIELIEECSELKEYFKKCENELRLMANIKFYFSYSYYCILKMSKNIKKLANLTKNEDFVKNFEAGLKFTYYKNNLRMIFIEATETREKNQWIEAKLKNIFGNLLPDIIVRKVAEHLNFEDLPEE